jgi:hypothetical protein
MRHLSSDRKLQWIARCKDNCVVAERDRSSGCVTFHARRLARADSSESKYEELLAIANNRRWNARGISRSQDYTILALIRVAGLRRRPHRLGYAT